MSAEPTPIPAQNPAPASAPTSAPASAQPPAPAIDLRGVLATPLVYDQWPDMKETEFAPPVYAWEASLSDVVIRSVTRQGELTAKTLLRRKNKSGDYILSDVSLTLPAMKLLFAAMEGLGELPKLKETSAASEPKYNMVLYEGWDKSIVSVTREELHARVERTFEFISGVEAAVIEFKLDNPRVDATIYRAAAETVAKSSKCALSEVLSNPAPYRDKMREQFLGSFSSHIKSEDAHLLKYAGISGRTLSVSKKPFTPAPMANGVPKKAPFHEMYPKIVKILKRNDPNDPNLKFAQTVLENYKNNVLFREIPWRRNEWVYKPGDDTPHWLPHEFEPFERRTTVGSIVEVSCFFDPFKYGSKHGMLSVFNSGVDIVSEPYVEGNKRLMESSYDTVRPLPPPPPPRAPAAPPATTAQPPPPPPPPSNDEIDALLADSEPADGEVGEKREGAPQAGPPAKKVRNFTPDGPDPFQ